MVGTNPTAVDTTEWHARHGHMHQTAIDRNPTRRRLAKHHLTKLIIASKYVQSQGLRLLLNSDNCFIDIFVGKDIEYGAKGFFAHDRCIGRDISHDGRMD